MFRLTIRFKFFLIDVGFGLAAILNAIGSDFQAYLYIFNFIFFIFLDFFLFFYLFFSYNKEKIN